MQLRLIASLAEPSMPCMSVSSCTETLTQHQCTTPVRALLCSASFAAERLHKELVASIAQGILAGA